jgi:tetratricopeptide (TPR) repeat protein
MFEKVNELNPKEPKAYLGLAKINLSLGKIDEANEYFKKVIDVDKNGTLANYAKRSITIAKRPLMANGNLTANYEKPEEYYSEGYRSYLINNFPKSIEMYKNYLMIKPDDDYVWCALGESYLRSGEIKAAIETFKKAAKISPQKALYYKELAIAFFYIDDFEKVVIAASKAKELGKADSVTYCIWGKSLLEKGNINEAIIMLDHSLRSNKNNLLAKYYLAEALAKNDDYLNAAGYLDEIISIKNSTPLKDKALELKKSLKER